MIYRYPSYCDKFRCIAEKCSDNCCIGWEIDIDEDTLRYYESVGGEFGRRLAANISDGCFTLGSGERCPFLNERNLCDIIISLGEEHICRICTEHPRYYEWFGSVKEGGIGLCCEEAAQLILSEDFDLAEREVPDEDCGCPDDELYRLLLSARSVIIEQLQSGSLNTALRAMLDFGGELQARIDGGDYTLPEFRQTTAPELPDIRGILAFLGSLEPIDEQWVPYVDSCAKMADKVAGDVPYLEPYLRRTAIYFVFRYFLKGVFDGEILSRVKLVAVSTWAIGCFWRCALRERGTLTPEDMALIAKDFSKEVEYSEDNLDALADASYDEEIFTLPRLIGLFSGG